MRVLLVEDDWIIAEAMKDMIEDAGHEVVELARDESQALQAAEEHRPDIAVTDLTLAGGDCGITVARLLLERFGIRSIYASAHAELKADKIRAFDPEPLALLPKPVLPERLAGALDAAVEWLAGRDRDQAAGSMVLMPGVAAKPRVK